jgi:nicotinamide riboside kinase
MTPFADEEIAEKLIDLGVMVETHNGYGPDDRRTVSVAARERRRCRAHISERLTSA